MDAGRQGGHRRRRLALVGVVHEHLRPFRRGDDRELRRKPLEPHGERGRVAGREAQFARLVPVARQAEDDRRDALGHMRKLDRRHAALDAVDEHGRPRRFGRAGHHTRIERQRLRAHERTAPLRLHVDAFRLVPRERQFQRMGAPARERRHEERRRAERHPLAPYVRPRRFGLHEDQPLLLREGEALLHVVPLRERDERIRRGVGRRLHVNPVLTRREVEHRTRRRTAHLPVHRHLRPLGPHRHVE